MLKSYLVKTLLLITLLVAGTSCQQDFSKVQDVLLKTEKLLLELDQALKQEEIPDFQEQAEINHRDSVLSFKQHTLVTWNIQHLGGSKTEKEIWEMAQLLRHYDIVAIQEVVAKDPAGAQAVARLADALNRMGAQWDYQVSNPTKSPSVYISERYAFLWKTSKVSIQHRAFLDEEREDLFYREPYIAKFKSKKTDKTFYVANYHSRKHSDQPQEEIPYLLDYAERWETPYMLLVGDFNVAETNKVWKPFYEKGYKSALNNLPTTLKRKCKDGEYTHHPIDNIYYTPKVIKHQANRIDFVGSCDRLEQARGLSDHLPVFIEFSLD